jgi:hypothetical protein
MPGGAPCLWLANVERKILVRASPINSPIFICRSPCRDVRASMCAPCWGIRASKIQVPTPLFQGRCSGNVSSPTLYTWGTPTNSLPEQVLTLWTPSDAMTNQTLCTADAYCNGMIQPRGRSQTDPYWNPSTFWMIQSLSDHIIQFSIKEIGLSPKMH